MTGSAPQKEERIMTGRVLLFVSMLLAAGCLMTGCTDRPAPEPDASSVQTETTAQSTSPETETTAAVTDTTAAKKQSSDSGEPAEFRFTVPEADIVIDPAQPDQPKQPDQPAQPDDTGAEPERRIETGPWIEIDY